MQSSALIRSQQQQHAWCVKRSRGRQMCVCVCVFGGELSRHHQGIDQRITCTTYLLDTSASTGLG